MADCVVMRCRALNTANASLGAVTALLGAACLAVALDEDVGLETSVLGVFLPMGMWFAIRSLRAGILLCGEHVVVKGMFRTRRFARSDLRGATAEVSATLLPWRRLVLETVDGRSVAVDGISTLRKEGGSVDEAMRTITAWLAG